MILCAQGQRRKSRPADPSFGCRDFPWRAGGRGCRRNKWGHNDRRTPEARAISASRHPGLVEVRSNRVTCRRRFVWVQHFAFLWESSAQNHTWVSVVSFGGVLQLRQDSLEQSWRRSLIDFPLSSGRTRIAPVAFGSVGGPKIRRTGWARCGTLGRDSSGESLEGQVLWVVPSCPCD